MALMRSLGYADAIRFLLEISPGQGDYMQWQDELFGRIGVDESYDRAQEHWRRQKEAPSQATQMNRA